MYIIITLLYTFSQQTFQFTDVFIRKQELELHTATGLVSPQPDISLCREYESVALGLSYPASTLSQREMELLSLAAQGLSRKEVAARLYISEETAKTHFKNIYQKLGANSKMTAIKLARDRGYLSM